MNGLVAESRGIIEASKRDGLKAGGTSLVEMAQDTARTWQKRRWSPAQRALAGASGSAFALYGYFRGGVKGAALCALGTALVARASANEELADVLRSRGILVQKSLIVDAPVEQVFAYWRNLENLPQFMRHLDAVEKITDTISHWRARGPAGIIVEWDAEVYNEVANKLIAWRSLEGSDVVSAGSVNFDRAADGRATRVTVHLQYSPPMGKVGAAVARLFGADAETEIRDDLQRFKTMVESGQPQ
jgi:uncharacterized membrane protein